MSKVFALIYPEMDIPQEIYDEVLHLEKTGAMELIEACEVEIKDNGKLKFEPSLKVPVLGDSDALFLSAFVGLLYFHPLHVANERVKEFVSSLSLDQNFVRTLRHEIAPRYSVLFLFVRNEETSEMELSLAEHGGTIIETALTDDQEEMLHRLFRGQIEGEPEVPAPL